MYGVTDDSLFMDIQLIITTIITIIMNGDDDDETKSIF